MQPDRATLDALICSVLRGERPAWPWPGDAEAIEAFLGCARMHGVHALLNASPLHPQWPPALREAARQEGIGNAIWELRHQQVLKEALAALAGLGAQPLLIKGTTMAYTLYPDPSLRTRGDTDIVVRNGQRAAVFAALESLGFQRDPAVSGEFVSYQCNFSRVAEDGKQHTLDVHWKFNNSPSLARLLDVDDAFAQAQPLAGLSPHALAVNPVHGLFITVFHRASHIHNPYNVDGHAHYGGERLIWLYDIHLLANSLDAAQWQSFCQLATGTGLAPICLEALTAAHDGLGTRIPAQVTSALSSAPPHTRVARYIHAGRLQQQWLDFIALGGNAARSKFLFELVFPAPGYMRHKYRGTRVTALPWLYARRVVEGLFKRLRANH